MAQAMGWLFRVVFTSVGGYLGFFVSQRYLELSVIDKNMGDQTGYKVWTISVLVALGMAGGWVLSSWVSRQFMIVADKIDELTLSEKLGAMLGVLLGVGAGTIAVLPWDVPGTIRLCLWLLAAVTCGYLGARVFFSMKDDIFLILPSHAAMLKAQGQAAGKNGAGERIKIFDTNVIIDGRIADICRTGFVEGPIYVPGCVLEELHHIADSAEGLKRARGRRGLDILNQMQKDMKLLVRTYDNIPLDGGESGEVDYRLVQYAKKLDGVIVTNDFNLNKVAELEGVSVLNVNELANALKPVVLPGEEMNVTLIREGKEINQGVAYLEDGTMVVVEGGRRHIGETLDVIVTSVLQTVAGKMIFAEVKSLNGEDESGAYMRGGGSGGWQRRKGR